MTLYDRAQFSVFYLGLNITKHPWVQNKAEVIKVFLVPKQPSLVKVVLKFEDRVDRTAG